MNGSAKQKLIVLVNGYPYGHREPYIEAELPFLAEKFDEILLCALNIRTKPEPEIPENELATMRALNVANVTVLPVVFASKVTYVFGGVCCLWDGYFWKELSKLKHESKLTKETLFALMKFISRARHEERCVSKHLRDTGFIEDAGKVVVYSYRFDYQPYIGLLLKKMWPELKVVARAHGRDLYEERVSANYIPLREAYLNDLDAVYCVSSHGRDYLLDRFPTSCGRVHVGRLGTVDHGWVPDCRKERGPFRIVSCSFLVPVKRVQLIVEALSSITDFDVEWTHFGGGPEEARLKEACRFLPSNIRVDFRGTVSNEEVLVEYVSNPFHCFINVSESEGVPVSIMEALSTGTPVIATDVGGTGEIVHVGVNGWLLPCEFETGELTSLIVAVHDMDGSSYRELRSGARRSWESSCCAENNYKQFADDLVRPDGR